MEINSESGITRVVGINNQLHKKESSAIDEETISSLKMSGIWEDC